MNGKVSKLYSWGLPKLKNELRLLQKKVSTNKQNWNKPYHWQSHQVWGFFTFWGDLVYCGTLLCMSRGFASNLMYSTKKESIVSLVFSVISSFFFFFLTQGKKVDMLCHHLPICFIQRASRFLTIHNGVNSILKQHEEFVKYSIKYQTKNEEISWLNNSNI